MEAQSERKVIFRSKQNDVEWMTDIILKITKAVNLIVDPRGGNNPMYNDFSLPLPHLHFAELRRKKL